MLHCVLWFGLGAGLGWLGFMSLQWTVERLDPAQGTAAAVWPVLGMILRWAAAAALLLCALRMDWLSGLSAFAGHLLAGRLALVRRIGRA
jgi:hypothetical protein